MAKYSVTFYYRGSIAHTVEATDKEQAETKAVQEAAGLTSAQFLEQLHLEADDIPTYIEELTS